MNKKNLLIIGVVLVVMLLAVPMETALAGLGQTIANFIIKYLMATFFFVGLLISWIIFAIGDGILRIVSSPLFIDSRYTTNPFVLYGWGIVRDFVNMFFVIILTFIGLGTALRISGYKWEKLLAKLVIVILLINFSPVILGLVIDASNILMNFFLSNVTGESIFLGRAKENVDAINTALNQADWFSWNSAAGAIILPIGLIAVNIAFGVFFGLYAILFMMRYAALWLLIIISPLAFLAYVLPSTESHFKKWVNQFTQWCTIGIGAAFFLYLADLLSQYANRGDLQMETSTNAVGAGAEVTGLLGPLIPLVMSCLFLILGFFIALTSSAAGSQAIVKGFQSGTKKIAGKYWDRKKTQAKRVIGEKTKRVAEPLGRVGDSVDKILKYERTDDKKGFSKVKAVTRNVARGMGGFATRQIRSGARSLGGWGESISKVQTEAVNEGAQAASGASNNKIEREINQSLDTKDNYRLAGILGEVVKMNEKNRNEILNNPRLNNDRIVQAVQRLGEQNKMNEAQLLILATLGKKESEKRESLKKKDNIGFAEKTKDISDFSSKINQVEVLASLKKEGDADIESAIMRKIKPENIERIDKDLWNEDKYLDIAVNNWKPNKISQAIEKFGIGLGDFGGKYIAKINSMTEESLKKWVLNNTSAANYITGSAGYKLGLGNVNLTRKKVSEIINTAAQEEKKSQQNTRINLNESLVRSFKNHKLSKTGSIMGADGKKFMRNLTFQEAVDATAKSEDLSPEDVEKQIREGFNAWSMEKDKEGAFNELEKEKKIEKMAKENEFGLDTDDISKNFEIDD